MRVLVVIPGSTYGGPHNEILILRERLSASDIERMVVLPDEPGDAEERLRAGGVSVRRLAAVRIQRARGVRFWLAYPWRFMRDVVRLSTLIGEVRPDVVHGVGVNTQLAFAAMLRRRPLVWSMVDISAPQSMRRLVGIVLWAMRCRVVFCSGSAVRIAWGMPAGLRDRAVVYYPPVELQEVARVSTTHAGVVVGTMSNINPDKAVEDLVTAADMLDSSTRVVHWGAVQPSHVALADDLRRKADRLGPGRFEFEGPATDAREPLRSIDIFALSSVREGAPTVIVEAMAAGLPVVATAVGGIPEIVADGVTGILVPVHDPASLAKAINDLAANPGRRAAMGRAGAARARTHFGADRTAAVFIRGYRQAAGLPVESRITQ